jgi:ketosteroid isomerase-like protein
MNAQFPPARVRFKDILPALLGIRASVVVVLLLAVISAAILLRAADTSVEKQKQAIAALDTEYQAAVKRNDAAAMDRLLADDFVLVTGSGKTYTKSDLLAQARSGRIKYEKQDDTEQAVRVWGDTAVITAKLWEKGTDNGEPFEYRLWFSDTYVRTASGWRYVFGQASLPLPQSPR